VYETEESDMAARLKHTETGDFPVLTSKGQQEMLFALERASEGVNTPIQRFEHALHSFCALVVMLLFGFANAGVKIDQSLQHAEIGFGILAEPMFGKPLGIMTAALIAVKSGMQNFLGL
jgi:NhaA family Na+:H+ antiporter